MLPESLCCTKFRSGTLKSGCLSIHLDRTSMDPYNQAPMVPAMPILLGMPCPEWTSESSPMVVAVSDPSMERSDLSRSAVTPRLEARSRGASLGMFVLTLCWIVLVLPVHSLWAAQASSQRPRGPRDSHLARRPRIHFRAYPRIPGPGASLRRLSPNEEDQEAVEDNLEREDDLTDGYLATPLSLDQPACPLIGPPTHFDSCPRRPAPPLRC